MRIGATFIISKKSATLSVHTVRAYVGDLDSFFEHLALAESFISW
jgi:hypothetical protein